jgi:hypothetical protein
MLRIIHLKGLALKFVFVYESEAARQELEFPSLHQKPQGCACRCYCICRHCKTKCDCKCVQTCPCKVPSEICRCFSDPIFFLLSSDGFPEDGDRNFYLREASLPANEISPISWCEQFADDRGSCRDHGGNFTVHCSAASVRNTNLQPCSENLRRRSICIIKRYRLCYRLRQLLAGAKMSREALSKGDFLWLPRGICS